jgi:hypothetical protein
MVEQPEESINKQTETAAQIYFITTPFSSEYTRQITEFQRRKKDESEGIVTIGSTAAHPMVTPWLFRLYLSDFTCH